MTTTAAQTASATRAGQGARTLLRQIVPHVSRVPLVGKLARAAYGRYFHRVHGDVRLFHGIYPDFTTAKRAVTVKRHLSYDNEASAHRVADEWLRIWPYDYPILFWLAQLLPDCRLILDWGGNVGLKYFAYRKYLTYPTALRWCVSDVPAVVAAGLGVARREQATGLSFTAGLEELANADLLLAAGSLHFIEDPFDVLRAAPRLPEHFLACKVPAHERSTVVTLQNMGTAICPYWLFNRSEFVANVEGLGYELIDEWTSPDCSCHIPFFADYSIGAYSGFYFRKRGRSAAPAACDTEREEQTLALR